VRQSFETSLRALQTDRVEALLLHEVAPEHITDDLKRTLQDLKQNGAVGAIGLATSAEHTETIARQHPELGEVVQIAAPAPGAPLPQNTTLILHSVLGGRLAGLITRLKADAALAERFSAEVGAGADAESAAGLLLAYEIARNPGGVTLFASSHARHIERNAAVLTQPFSAEQTAAFERFVTSVSA
jgi:aryl-alcohol dehydrogenase-like predicted oxidoreductase